MAINADRIQIIYMKSISLENFMPHYEKFLETIENFFKSIQKQDITNSVKLGDKLLKEAYHLQELNKITFQKELNDDTFVVTLFKEEIFFELTGTIYDFLKAPCKTIEEVEYRLNKFCNDTSAILALFNKSITELYSNLENEAKASQN